MGFMKRRVVITGLGAITPIGNNVTEYWQNLIAGVNGIDYITKFDAQNFSVRIAGEVKNFNPENHFEKKDLRRMEDFIVYGMVAAREAVKDAQLDLTQCDPTRIGVIIG
ncbi:MAG: beta-ketoacyl-[acyl-carrier-protein] synthase II, partial [Candidatus Sumerlaeia bacterium]|nr:beta-ketoacyl-[acyl-carrier-protein] synthase II [Candidatus Sumerlaeia bacterium]